MTDLRTRCACGGVVAGAAADPPFAIARHCIDCQRRTGAPFGAGVYYAAAAVTITGPTTGYDRGTESGDLPSFDSLRERSKHAWISIDAAIAHYPTGYPEPA